MIEPYRSRFNAGFTQAKYGDLLSGLERAVGTPIEFRVCETPCFFERSMLDGLAAIGTELTHQLVGNAAYRAASEASIPDRFRVGRENARPNFMTVDFGFVRGVGGGLEPKLVELQAFPSLYGYQDLLSRQYLTSFGMGDGFDRYMGGLEEESYWALLRRVVLGGHAAENVILVEIDPQRQKTLADFRVYEQRLGIRTVDVASLRKEGRRLLYERDGRWVEVERIYNRAIVEELERKQVRLGFDYRDDLEVEWAGHPNWFFRISKFSLPYLKHKSVPAAVFLDEWFRGEAGEGLPEDRSRLLLKPLYSFAGKGIVFSPTDAELKAIPKGERQDYILQERVTFAPVIATPEGATQAEVRVMYLWPEDGELAPVMSLVRLGRGLMMGVDHNRDRTWVGASAALVPII